MENISIPSLQRMRVELQKRANMHKAEIDRLRTRARSSEKELISMRRGLATNSQSSAAVLLERAREELHEKLLEIQALQKTTKYMDTMEAHAQLNIATIEHERLKTGTTVEIQIQELQRRTNAILDITKSCGSALVTTENDFIAAVTQRDALELVNSELSRKLDTASKSGIQPWLLSRSLFEACYQGASSSRKATISETAAKLRPSSHQLIDELVGDDIGL